MKHRKGPSILTFVFVVVIIAVCIIAVLAFIEVLGIDEDAPRQLTPDWWGL